MSNFSLSIDKKIL